eukprot:3249033-Pyramimonas_sp.AAC.1
MLENWCFDHGEVLANAVLLARLTTLPALRSTGSRSAASSVCSEVGSSPSIATRQRMLTRFPHPHAAPNVESKFM